MLAGKTRLRGRARIARKRRERLAGRRRTQRRAELLEPRMLLAAGDPDLSFGTDGIATFSVDALDTDSDVTTKVFADNSVLTVTPITAVKTLADGSPDTSYGANGVAVSNDTVLRGKALVRDDGSYIMVGREPAIRGSDYQFYGVTANGQVDTSFGIGGEIEHDFSPRSIIFADAVFASDGGFYVLGEPGSSTQDGIYLSRYDVNGNAVTSFGDDGLLFVPSPNGRTADGEHLLLDENGNLLVVGLNRQENFNDELVYFAKATPDGALLTSFGDNGFVVTDTLADAFSNVVQLPGGDLVVTTEDRFNRTIPEDFTEIHRFDSQGDRVTSFADGGTLSLGELDIRQRKFTGGLAVDSSGRILVAGDDDDTDLLLLRLTSDGQIDTTFGDFGIASNGGQSELFTTIPNIEFDSLGRIVTSSVIEVGSQDRPAVFRFENEDAVCPAQGCVRFAEQFPIVSEGTATITLVRQDGSAGAVSVRLRSLTERDIEATPNVDYTPVDTIVTFADGQTTATATIAITQDNLDEAPETILLEISEATGGAVLNNPQKARMTIQRQGLNPVELRDGFGTGGIVALPFGSSDLRIEDVFHQTDGKLVVVGTDVEDDGDFLVVRFNADGTLDESFSIDGILTADFNLEAETANAIAQQSDGALIIAGQSDFAVDAGVAQPRATLLRLLPDGSPDRSFGIGGRLVDNDLRLESYVDVLVLDDDSVITLGQVDRFDATAGATIHTLVVQKRLADGTLDATFGQGGELRFDDVESLNGGKKLASDENGTLYVLGSTEERIDTNTAFRIVRSPVLIAVSTSGVPVSGFGTGGVEVLRELGFDPLDNVFSGGLAADQDGKPVISFTQNVRDDRDFINQRAAVVRLQSDGSRDVGFGTDGIAVASHDVDIESHADDITLTPNGRIWVSGRLELDNLNEQTIGVVSFLPDGTPDPAIESIGFTNFEAGFQRGDANIITLPSGEVVIAAHANVRNDQGDFVSNITLIKVAGGEATGRVKFALGEVEVDENAGEVSLEVLRTDGTTGAGTVELSTRDGSATAANDYSLGATEIAFADGQNRATVTIQLTNDGVLEGRESFFVELVNPSNVRLGTRTETEITIVDGPGAIAFAEPVFGATENQDEKLITLARSNGTDGEVSVRVTGIGVEATAGADFVPLDEVVTFAEGQSTAQLAVRLLDDNVSEGIETISLQLSNPTGGSVLGDQVTSVFEIFDVEPFQSTTAGARDVTFGEAGASDAIREIDPAFFGATIAVANRPGGSFVVADENFRLFGILAGGEIDTTFGEGGFTFADVPAASSNAVRSEGFVVDNQGRFLLVGRRSLGLDSDIVVVRFTDDGQVDSSFGTDGIAVVDTGADDRGFSVVVDGSDRVYVAGSSGGLLSRVMVVSRLNPDGSVDDSFADSGILRLPASELMEEATAITISDDRLLIAGHTVSESDQSGTVASTSNIVVHRTSLDGVIDSGFGDAGRFEGEFEDRTGNTLQDDRVRKLIPLDGGRVLVIGSTDGEFLIARLTDSGELDTSFGFGDGYTTGAITPGGRGNVGIDFARDAIVDENGLITVVGVSEPRDELAVVRLLENGLPDPDFGIRGARLFTQGDAARGGDAIVAAEGGGLLVSTSRGQVLKLLETTVCPPGGCVQFATLDNTVDESTQTIDIRVSRPAGRSEGVVTVDYMTVDGSAEQGTDYIANSGTLTFQDNESSKVISIEIVNDEIFESDETFFIVLDNPSGGAVLGAQFVVPVAIRNDETQVPEHFVSVTSGTFAEDAGQANIRIRTFSSIFGAERTEPIELSYTTVATGTATAGVDYTPTSGTVMIAPEDSQVFVPVPIVFDDEIEETETFRFVISAVTGATLSLSSVDIRIANIESTTCEAGPGTPLDHFGSDGFSAVDPNPATNNDTGPIFTDVGPNGRIVQLGSLDSRQSGISVIRTLADGTPDTTFGDGGVVRLPSVQNGGTQADEIFELPRAVRQLGDGKVLVVGQASNDRVNNLFVVRLNANGSLDASFGDGGIAFTPLANFDVSLSSAVIAPDGSIYLSGSAGVEWRSNNSSFYGRVVDPNTSVPVAFTTSHRTVSAIMRVSPDGQLDTTFGSGGGILLSGGASVSTIGFDPSGATILVLNGFELKPDANTSQSVVRLNQDGSIDDSFSDDEFFPAVEPPDEFPGFEDFEITGVRGESQISRLVPTNDGFVALTTVFFFAEIAEFGTEFFVSSATAVSRHLADGSLVTSFGNDGVTRLPDELGVAVQSIAVQPDGRVVLAGQALGQLALNRLRPDGQFDAGFGGLGLLRVPNTTVSFGANVQLISSTDEATTISYRDQNDFTLVGLSSGPSVGAVRLGRSTTSIGEDGGTVELLLRRVCGVDGAISVNVATSNGTATGGVDYTPINLTVDFADGEFEQLVSVPIVDNGQLDGDRDFTVSLSNPVGGATITTVTTTTVTIIDDEQPGRIQFVGGPVTVDETDAFATVTLERIDGDGGTATVLVTPTGTATAGQDYTFQPSVVTFADGDRSQTLQIPIIDDDLVEPSLESIVLTLSDPSAASLGFLTTTTVTIADDDSVTRPPEGTFSVSVNSATVGEADGVATFTINRTNGDSGQVVVNYAITSDTATLNADYLGGSGQVSFADGQMTRTVSVPIIDDNAIEGDESILVSITNVDQGRIDLDNVSSTITILDDDSAGILLDFGDAPDSYRTLAANDGPSHVVGSGLVLGQSVTSDADGTPSASADGDSDDDGVVGLAASLTPGQSVDVDVTASIPVGIAGAAVQGWIDFNRDGEFAENERVVTNEFYGMSETRALSIAIPEDAEIGTTYARFRISTLGSLSPVGNAPDGEVEDFRLTIGNQPNTAPTVDAGGPYAVDEGGMLALMATGNDAEDGANITYEWDFDFDGTTFDVDASGRDVNLSQVLDPPSSFVVAVRATDTGGLSTIDTATVTVNNLAPIISSDQAEVTAVANTQATAMGSFSDPGLDPVLLSASVGMVTGSGGRYTWTGPSNAGVVTITATDDDQASSTTSFTVREVAENTPPTVDANGPYSVNEGETLVLAANGADAEDGNQITYEWDLSFDGTFNVDATGQSVSVPLVLDPPDSFVVAVRVTDSGALSATDTATVNVVNLPPTISADQSIVVTQPGTNATMSGDFADPGNDPVTLTASIGSVTGNAGRFTWIGPADAGTVTITATDDDNASATTTFTAQEAVNNPPTVDAGGPYSVDEGASVQLAATGNDIETDAANLVFAWDLDGDGEFDDATGRVITVSNVQDPPTSFDVSVRVTDGGGISATDTATIGVNNLPPTIQADRVSLVATEGTQVTAGGSFSDPGDDPLQLTASVGTVTGSNGRYVWSGPSDAGSVTITVTDDNGATDSTTFTIREIPVGGGSVPWLPGIDPLAARTDVNRDGRTSALDALMVINYLGASRLAEGDTAGTPVDVSVYDVNEDGRVSARDALAIINRISRQTVAESEEIDRVIGDVETWVDEQGQLF